MWPSHNKLYLSSLSLQLRKKESHTYLKFVEQFFMSLGRGSNVGRTRTSLQLGKERAIHDTGVTCVRRVISKCDCDR